MGANRLDLETARALAGREFLGRHHVVAVGLSDAEWPTLVFFLEKTSRLAELLIDSWARQRGLPIDIEVVGSIAPASQTREPRTNAFED